MLARRDLNYSTAGVALVVPVGSTIVVAGTVDVSSSNGILQIAPLLALGAAPVNNVLVELFERSACSQTTATAFTLVATIGASPVALTVPVCVAKPFVPGGVEGKTSMAVESAISGSLAT